METQINWLRLLLTYLITNYSFAVSHVALFLMGTVTIEAPVIITNDGARY